MDTDIQKLYKRTPKPYSPAGTGHEIKGMSDLNKTIIKMGRDHAATQRKVDALTKDIKYLKDRMSSSERKSDQLSGIINSLSTKVQRVMEIFKR